MKQKLKQTKGITLIALVITIIVLLILAGVSIAMLTGENGILTQANNSKVKQSHGAVREAIALAYNEYQIEINTASNTKLASTETVQIQGKEEKALASYSSFLDFLESKGYIKEGTTDVLNVEALTGGKQALGNGEDTDIYKIEEENGKYLVNYYGGDNDKEEIWNVNNINTNTGGLELEPDTGKEALILVYNVSAGDRIELPYNLNWYDSESNRHDVTFDFDVDWGDGSTTEDITNDSIGSKATHQYEEEGEKRIIITGRYEVLSNGYPDPLGDEKLISVEQWGTTGLKEISLTGLDNFIKIESPTENSFKDLVRVSFSDTGIQTIPENLFANCPNVTSFSYTFSYTDITSIPENLFANCPNVTSFVETFKNTPITSIPENLFANCPNVTNFAQTFRGTAITSIPENLFAHANWDKVEYLSKCFTGCRNLRGKAPELWLEGTNSEENDYQGKPDGFACFTDCTNLDNYNEIPEYWKTSFVE